MNERISRVLEKMKEKGIDYMHCYSEQVESIHYS